MGVKKLMFASQKGGVAKTTSTGIMAEILAAAGFRILVVDLDPQGNITKMLTGNSIYKYTGSTILEAVKESNAEKYTLHLKDNLDLIPAEDYLATFSRHIYSGRTDNPVKVISRTIEPVEDLYDYIFMDVGPSLGDLTFNAVVYADYIVVPVDYGDFGMDAISRFIEFVDASREEGSTNANILGILLTMKDARSRYEKDIATVIKQEYGDLVFQSEIRRRTDIKKIATYGVNLSDPVLEDYMAMTEEFISRMKQMEDNKDE